MLRKTKTSHSVCLGGIFVSIAVVFQAAPVFLPLVGQFLSPLSTLPIILAAVFEIPLGIMVLFSSALLLFAISPQEAIIMLLTTGPLGIGIGALLYREGYSNCTYFCKHFVYRHSIVDIFNRNTGIW